MTFLTTLKTFNLFFVRFLFIGFLRFKFFKCFIRFFLFSYKFFGNFLNKSINGRNEILILKFYLIKLNLWNNVK